jgi:hypothetical protein
MSCISAHASAQRRKSPWNLAHSDIRRLRVYGGALLVSSSGSINPSTQVDHHATGAGQRRQCRTRLAAIPLAFIVANAMVWLVPPARRALNHEAQGHPGTTFLMLSAARHFQTLSHPRFIAAVSGFQSLRLKRVAVFEVG